MSGITVHEPISHAFDNTIHITWSIARDVYGNEQVFRESWTAAYKAMIEKTALLVLREHREEIEAAFSVEELKQALAAELTKQFVAGILGAARQIDEANRAPSR